MKNVLVCFVSAFALATVLPTSSSAQMILGVHDGDVRIAGDLDDLPGGGNAGDENGGNTLLVVGINTGRVQNWALFGYDVSAGTGETALGAELRLDINSLTNGNHGDAGNTFSIHELFAGNVGYAPGGQGIQNNVANVANPGVVSFQQQAFGSTNWVDGSGADVDNFIGAFDNSVPLNINTVNGWGNGTLPNVGTAEEGFITLEFSAATAQGWLDDGRADLVLEIDDPDGNNTSRFVVQNGQTNTLTVFTVPEPSSLVLLLSGLATVVFRRRR